MCPSGLAVIMWKLLVISAASVGALFLLLCFGYKYLIFKLATLEVKSQPREPMHECGKHGIMREAHLIHHLGQKYCPYCWSERLSTKLDSTIT